MQYEKESSVICLGDTKQAALYFDRILPVSFLFKEMLEEMLRHPRLESYLRSKLSKDDGKLTEEDGAELRSEIETIINDDSSSNSILNILSIFENLLGEIGFDHIKDFVIPAFEILNSLMRMIMLAGMLYSKKDRLDEFPKSVVERVEHVLELKGTHFGINELHQILHNMNDVLSIFYAKEIQIENFSRSIRRDIDVISEKWAGKCGQVLVPSSCMINDEATESDVSLCLANINLIDTSKIEWNQIIEYRRDEEARKKIRNLRLFLHTNYQDKSRAFIEDDLGKRLDEYYDTCKGWGFETLISTISVVMDSKNLISLLAGSTCATLFGDAVAGLIAGATIEIGKISLNIAKRKHAFNRLKRNHDLAYIIEAKEYLENESLH